MKKLLLATLILAGISSEAAPISELGGRTVELLGKLESAESGIQCEAKHFYLTIMPFASFEFPEIAEISVQPQITIIWEREDQGQSKNR